MSGEQTIRQHLEAIAKPVRYATKLAKNSVADLEAIETALSDTICDHQERVAAVLDLLPTLEEIADEREWLKNWRDGMYDSGSRDKDGWPMEMHGLAATFERVLDLLDDPLPSGSSMPATPHETKETT